MERRKLRSGLTKEETLELIESKIEDIHKEYGKKARIAVLEILTLERSLNQTIEKARFIPVSKWNDYHDYPTVSAIRNYINKSDKNGFDRVIKRKGKRILINETKMFEWINEE